MYWHVTRDMRSAMQYGILRRTIYSNISLDFLTHTDSPILYKV